MPVQPLADGLVHDVVRGDAAFGADAVQRRLRAVSSRIRTGEVASALGVRGRARFVIGPSFVDDAKFYCTGTL